MQLAARVLLSIGLILAVVTGSACGGSSGTATGASPNASARATAAQSGGSGQLDPAVSLPAGFPSDVPIYSGSRLTAQSSVTSNGQQTWAMVWETLDSVDRVQAFYAAQLNQADWTTTFTGNSAAGGFGAYFMRKSDSKVAGIVTADRTSGVTKITVALIKSP